MKNSQEIKEVAEQEIIFWDTLMLAQSRFKSNMYLIFCFIIASVLFRFFLEKDQWFYHAFYIFFALSLVAFCVSNYLLQKSVKRKSGKAAVELKKDFRNAYLFPVIVLAAICFQYFVLN